MKPSSIMLTYCILIILTLNSCRSKQTLKENDDVEIKKEFNFKNSKFDEIPECFFDTLWVHRHKEDKDGLLFFKSEQQIKYSQLYRNQLLFRKDGTCMYRWLASNNVFKMKEAIWTYIPDRLYLLENEIDIIDVYRIHSISDSLLLMKLDRAPIDKILGKWKLVKTKGKDVRYLGYVIDLKGKDVSISRDDIVVHSYLMSHSLRKIHEPIALNFDTNISKLYP